MSRTTRCRRSECWGGVSGKKCIQNFSIKMSLKCPLVRVTLNGEIKVVLRKYVLRNRSGYCWTWVMYSGKLW